MKDEGVKATRDAQDFSKGREGGRICQKKDISYAAPATFCRQTPAHWMLYKFQSSDYFEF